MAASFKGAASSGPRAMPVMYSAGAIAMTNEQPVRCAVCGRNIID